MGLVSAAEHLVQPVGVEICGPFCSFLGPSRSFVDGPLDVLALLQLDVAVNRRARDDRCCTRQKEGVDLPHQVAGEEVAAVGEEGALPHDDDLAIRTAALDGLSEASAVGAQDETTGGSGLAEAAKEPLGYCCTEVHSHEGTHVVEVEVEVSAPRTHAGADHMPAFASVPVLWHLAGVSTVAGAVPFVACLAGHTQTGAWCVVFQGRHLRLSFPSFHDPVVRDPAVPSPSLVFLARTSTGLLHV